MRSKHFLATAFSVSFIRRRNVFPSNTKMKLFEKKQQNINKKHLLAPTTGNRRLYRTINLIGSLWLRAIYSIRSFSIRIDVRMICSLCISLFTNSGSYHAFYDCFRICHEHSESIGDCEYLWMNRFFSSSTGIPLFLLQCNVVSIVSLVGGTLST